MLMSAPVLGASIVALIRVCHHAMSAQDGDPQEAIVTWKDS